MKKLGSSALLILLVLPLIIGGGSKQKIGVTFDIMFDRWEAYFGEELDWIKNEGSKLIVRTMEKYFGFLDFQQETGDYNLEIIVKEMDATTSERSLGKDLVIHMSLRLPDSTEAISFLYWIFVGEGLSHINLQTKEIFLDDVKKSLVKYIVDNKNVIVNDLFSKVRIADKAHLVKEERKWYIPLECGPLRMEDDTEFRIETRIEGRDGHYIKKYFTRLTGATKDKVHGVPELYWGGKIISEAFGPKEEIMNMQRGSEIGVWIKKYIPPDPEGGLSLTQPSGLRTKDEDGGR